MINLITPMYLAGFLESDGTFRAAFSNKQLRVEVRFAQKSNPNLLPLIANYLEKHEISGSFDNEQKTTNNRKRRAPIYRIQGFNNVRKLIWLLRKDCKPFLFTGVKQRDFLIIQRLVDSFGARPNDQTNALSQAQRLGVMKSLHKTTRTEPDFDLSGSISRETYEKRFDLQPNQSVHDSEQILKSIDFSYDQHQQMLKNSIQNGSLVVPADYIAGVVDGDGYFGVRLRERKENRPGKGKDSLSYEPMFEVTMDVRSLTTLEVLRYACSSNVTINRGKQSNSLSFLMRNHLELKRILQIFEEDFQLIGELRTKQLALIRKFFELQTNNQLSSYESASNFVNEIYEVAKLSTKGRRRKYSCEQALELVHKYTTENEFKS